MGSLLLAALMARTSLFHFVLCIIVSTWLVGKGKSEKEYKGTYVGLADNGGNQLRNIRSTEDTKKQTKTEGSKKKKRTKNVFKNKKAKRTQKAKGKKDNGKTKKNINKTKLTKQLNRSRKHKRKGNERKIKTKKTKSKSKKGKQRTNKKTKTRQTTVSCPSSSVSAKCLENAMLSLAYEKNQVTNYIKQAKRLDNHQNISSNKLTKKDEFGSAAKHMLWAIGGNLSDPKCGEDTNETKRLQIQKRDLKSSVANYNKLLNCSETIKEACDLKLQNHTYNHEAQSENKTLCRKFKNDFIKVSKECQSVKDQGNATLQCECWGKAAQDVTGIKKLKCETKDNQKFVTKHKNDCIKAFGNCKKMEDEAVDLIHKCMHDHSNKFINQTAEGLHAAAEKAGRGAFQERLAQLDISF